LRFRLLPREEEFFDLFTAVANRCQEAAVLLREQLTGRAERAAYCAESIKRLENEADEFTHEVVNRLDRTFITPIDREDIHALASSLDDVMDAIDAAAAVIRLYKIQQVRAGARRLADIICDAVDLLAEAFGALEKRQGVLAIAARVSQLEHEADRVHQDAIVGLFDQERDPITVIKWKEIYDFLEAATDRCEDVANLLEGVVVKNG